MGLLWSWFGQLPNAILCYFTDLLAPHGLCSCGGHLFHPGKFAPFSGKGAEMVEFRQLGRWGGAMDNCSLSYVGVLQVSDTLAVFCSYCWLGDSCVSVFGRQVNCSRAEIMYHTAP